MLQLYFNHLSKYKLAIWTYKRKQTNFTIEKILQTWKINNSLVPDYCTSLFTLAFLKNSWTCMHYIVKD